MSTVAPIEPALSSWARAWSGRRRWPLRKRRRRHARRRRSCCCRSRSCVVQAQQSGWGEVERLLFRHTVAVLLWNTVRLALACTVLCACSASEPHGASSAPTLPGATRCGRCCSCCRSASPTSSSASAGSRSIPACTATWPRSLVMTLSLYPLVYLPVAGALARLDGSLEEAARSLGHGTVADLLARHAAPDPAGGARRLPARDARPAGRVRRVRDRPVPGRSRSRSSPSSSSASTPSARACSRSCSSLLSVAALGGELALSGRGARLARAGRARGGPRAARARSGAAVVPVLAALAALARPRARRAARLARLLDAARQLEHAALHLDPRRARPHRRLQRRRRGPLDAARGARDARSRCATATA